MEASFWHERWEAGRTAFHEDDGNALLKAHIGALSLPKGARVFVPLAGKTRDIAWLLHQGLDVVACELNALAVKQLFDDLGVVPGTASLGEIEHRSAPNLDVFVGDIFDLTSEGVGNVDAVFDRAAVVAMPAHMRKRYVDQVITLSGGAPQLVVTLEYGDGVLTGPPFSVVGDEMERLYTDTYELASLHNDLMPGGFRGVAEVREAAWHLTPKSNG